MLFTPLIHRLRFRPNFCNYDCYIDIQISEKLNTHAEYTIYVFNVQVTVVMVNGLIKSANYIFMKSIRYFTRVEFSFC